ncbi:F-box only protein 31-like [Myotis yumanensis]|uniref:F-box only protein 31-like n=1 Tax=Myotis yumanensis TaxID=159337 RepID=UPI0038D3C546
MAVAEGKRCRQECQGPAEMAAANGKPAPAEKHLEADAAARCCAGSGGIASPMPPPHCSLQDLPVEMLVEIFASLPGTDLPSLALACTKFHHILFTDSIWRRRCREEFGIHENLQDLKMIGMSYREFYVKMFPYRNMLGLWQYSSCKELLNVVVDGLCITGWMYSPSLNTHVDGPMQFKPWFRIHLRKRKSATAEYMDNYCSLSYRRHMQIQKNRFSIQWIKRDHQKDSPTWLRGKQDLVLSQEAREVYDDTYLRVYLPPCHPDDLIRPGLFSVRYNPAGLMIAMLSFHGKYARVTKITGLLIGMLKIHLMRRIQLRDGEIFRNFNELSHVVQQIDEQVIWEQQQQQEDGTEENEGHGWMCFYGKDFGTLDSFLNPKRCPGVFILFDENRFGFIRLDPKSFILYSRVQNTFQNVEAPSPQAFLEMLSNILSFHIKTQSLLRKLQSSERDSTGVTSTAPSVK